MKAKIPDGPTCTGASFQLALDATDVIGNWEWTAASDRARVDPFVALLFNVDPDEAELGLPLSAFIDSIHSEDRQRILTLIRQSALEGSSYLAEYRVGSVDGQTRWVLARGRFTCDSVGRPLSGRGILVDITRLRLSEEAFDEADAVFASPLDRLAELAIATRLTIDEMKDDELKRLADALLLGVGRRIAQQQVRDRRRGMN
ncbi:PAS domain-containing protein [Methylobacterium dankookense]|uniref:PAC domain-containing protein n=1 Tax=Methylobacterium dankookense TaxID=560405 RepID=A0A564G2A8_9HYPH|nr:PAS domain-containing protein [Methylobacterium dankookense]GJD55196.1 hypothetical protein IFDJLNFL_1079 [Methylobacterium dankookense]VUF14146.1 hypothetical protein MTDSW087_03861 [Methylobacterium dankookense]